VIRLILDTHVLLWVANADARLGRAARRLVDTQVAQGAAGIATVSFWETAMLHRRGRLNLSMAPDAWRRHVLAQGFVEVPLDGAMATLAAELARFHPDPADRLITATAMRLGAVLLTADERILIWTGTVDRLSAEH